MWLLLCSSRFLANLALLTEIALEPDKPSNGDKSVYVDALLIVVLFQ